MTPDEVRRLATTPEHKADDAKAHEFLAHVMPLAIAALNPANTDPERAEATTLVARHVFSLEHREALVVLTTLMASTAELGGHLYGHHACKCGDQ